MAEALLNEERATDGNHAVLRGLLRVLSALFVLAGAGRTAWWWWLASAGGNPRGTTGDLAVAALLAFTLVQAPCLAGLVVAAVRLARTREVFPLVWHLGLCVALVVGSLLFGITPVLGLPVLAIVAALCAPLVFMEIEDLCD